MDEKERLCNYIRDNFNVDVIALNLIYGFYDYIVADCGYLRPLGDGKYINNAIEDFIGILNDVNIDITLEELLENEVLDTDYR